MPANELHSTLSLNHKHLFELLLYPADIQREMASLIPNSKLILYPGHGHGNDQENPDYEVQVRKFCQA